MGYQNQVEKSLAQMPGVYRPVGVHSQLAVATAQTVSVPTGANGLLVQTNGANVRYTIDGTTPTTTLGFLLTAGASPALLYKIDEDCVFRFIEVAATATLEYQGVRITGQ